MSASVHKMVGWHPDSSGPLPSASRSAGIWPIGIDLFAGAGGFSLGALLAQVEIVAAVEKDKHACSTYRYNLIESERTRAKLFSTDILDIDPQTLLDEVGISYGDCDILLGGPPCQGFSSHRLNNAGVNDPRNSLLIRYFEFVKAIRPRFFLVENVPGMLWPRHRSYVETFCRLARDNDYDLLDPLILNARSFGAPQNRRRAFLFGTDSRQAARSAWPPEATHFDPKAVLLKQRSWRPAADVFIDPAPAGDENDIHMRHNADLLRAFERTPVNGGSRGCSGLTAGLRHLA